MAAAATSPFWLFLLTARHPPQPVLRSLTVIPMKGSPELEATALRVADQIADLASRSGEIEVVKESPGVALDTEGLRSVGTRLGVDFILRVKLEGPPEHPQAELHLVTPQRPSLPVWIGRMAVPGNEAQLQAEAQAQSDRVIRATLEAPR